MKEKTQNSTKRKKLLYWISAAAFLLIVAAITVGLIFGLRGNGHTLSADNIQQQGPDEGNNPSQNEGNNPSQNEGNNPPKDEGNNPPEGGDKDTSSQYEFIVPIKDVNLIKSHEFNWDKTMSWFCLHQAIDFGAPAGTEVYAAVDGKIVSIVTSDLLNHAYIEIEHANNLVTVYKFIDPLEELKVGQEVSRGQLIGTVASTTASENADGDHLHFEVWKENKPADPDEYLNIISK